MTAILYTETSDKIYIFVMLNADKFIDYSSWIINLVLDVLVCSIAVYSTQLLHLLHCFQLLMIVMFCGPLAITWDAVIICPFVLQQKSSP